MTLKPFAWGKESLEKGQKKKLEEIPPKAEVMAVMGLNQVSQPQLAGHHFDYVLEEGRLERKVQIAVSEDNELGDGLRKLLIEYQDVFAFEVDEMPGIDPRIAVHKLNIESGAPPVKQKKRNLGKI